MKKAFLALSASLAFGSGVCAQTVDRQAALDAIVATEHAFARMAAEKNVREAFLTYLAEDSLLFTPDPVPGREATRARPATPALLTWYPVYADVSLAGDLGYDTGPWELRPQGKDDPNVLYGTFMSIWKKQADGSYRAVIDFGVQHDKPQGAISPAIPRAEPATIPVKDLPKVDEAATKEALLAADRALARAAETRGGQAAYAAALAENARLLQTGASPLIGRKAILDAMATGTSELVTWKPEAAHVSKSGDLGYTYGTVQRRQGGPEGPWVDVDRYVHIWKQQRDGWKLVMDVTNPLPPKSPQRPPG